MTEQTLSFVQLRPFTAEWGRLGLGDDDLIALEAQILRAPTASPLVPGTGGLRKLRFAPPSWRRGKSGAARVMFFFFQAGDTVFLMAIYTKHDQSDFTPAQRAEAKRLIQELERVWPRARRK